MKIPFQVLESAENALMQTVHAQRISDEAVELLATPLRQLLEGENSLQSGLRSGGIVERSPAWSTFESTQQLCDFVQSAAASTVRVEGYTSGSGFVLNSKKDVLTALHVVGNNDVVRVTSNALSAEKGVHDLYRVHRRFDDLDTAWLRKSTKHGDNFANLKMPAVRPILDTGSISEGSAVAVLGNPGSFNKSLTVSPGTWLKERGFMIDNTEYPMSNLFSIRANVGPGNSGGAGFMLDGRVIGMVKALSKVSSEDTGKAFLVPFTTIKRRIYASDPEAIRL
jgi:S1-C subfamily serine protease